MVTTQGFDKEIKKSESFNLSLFILSLEYLIKHDIGNIHADLGLIPHCLCNKTSFLGSVSQEISTPHVSYLQLWVLRRLVHARCHCGILTGKTNRRYRKLYWETVTGLVSLSFWCFIEVANQVWYIIFIIIYIFCGWFVCICTTTNNSWCQLL